MTTRIFVSCDAAALSMGAEAVATAVQNEIVTRKLDAKLVRNGSRGMLWLEPLLEVETPAGRVGYGPVTPADVKSIFDNLGGAHKLNLGLVEADSLFRQAAAADLCALRHHRSACRSKITKRMAA